MYKIATGEDIKSLENAVNELLSLGWEPVGGVCVTTKETRSYHSSHTGHREVDRHLLFCQAVVNNGRIVRMG